MSSNIRSNKWDDNKNQDKLPKFTRVLHVSGPLWKGGMKLKNK